MKYFEASEFTTDLLRSKVGERRIAVVFSTFGEREADLVADKITLFVNELSDLCERIVLSHRRASSESDRTEKSAQEAYEATDILICNDYAVPDMDSEKGKGADMRRAVYHLIRDCGYRDDDIVVFLDSDVVTELFGTHFFLGLAGAVLCGADFAKASFFREMGRVKKYVAQPLFSVIEHESIKELTNLAYPLSGEVAGTVGFFKDVHFWQMYGVETGINMDAVTGGSTVADVNLGNYDHEHSGDLGIQKMSFGIIRTYLKKLQEAGLIQFAEGAQISDTFAATYIDRELKRDKVEADLSERTYETLRRITG